MTEVLTATVDQAAWFTSRGISVLPVNGKTGDVKKAKPSTELIKGNYGIALGNGLIGIDFDEYDGAPIPIESFVKTRMWRSGSGKGYGLLYKVSEELSNQGMKLLPGITIRACGSYLVGPGSIHPGNPVKGIEPGGIYTLVNDVEIADAPEEILQQLRERTTRATGSAVLLGTPLEPTWAYGDSKWKQKFEATEIKDRSDACNALVWYSAERGANNDEIAWIYQNFQPALDKYGSNLDTEIARQISKIRIKHPHPDAACDEVQCENTPDWMHKELVTTDIWSSSPILQYIYNEARFRRVPPKAVLLSVLAHICASIPTEFVLPAIIGEVASLNFFVAFVGESGDGKGSSTRVASRLFNYSATGFNYHVGKGGSGEGLVGIYAYWNPIKKEIVHKTKSAFLNINEIDDLAATGSRNGSTMLSTLREAWFAEPLGHDYVKNPTQLPELSYRLSLQVSAQPLRSKWLLDDVDGGLTQRIVFVSTADPECLHPDAVFERPAPVTWVIPKEITELARDKKAKAEEAAKKSELLKGLEVTETKADDFDPFVIPVCELARKTVLLEHWKRKTQPRSAIDSHFLLAQEKVATLMAILHGKMEIDEENWKRAAIIMSWSKRTIDEINTEVEKKRQIEQHARTTAAADRQEYIERRSENTKLEDTKKKVFELVKSGTTKLAGANMITQKLRRQREYVNDAVEALITEGKLKYSEDKKELELVK